LTEILAPTASRLGFGSTSRISLQAPEGGGGPSPAFFPQVAEQGDVRAAVDLQDVGLAAEVEVGDQRAAAGALARDAGQVAGFRELSRGTGVTDGGNPAFTPAASSGRAVARAQ
jgi:hypothetical protein